MLKSVMNDDEQAFSSIMELIFEKLYSLHVLSHAEQLCVNGRGGYPRSWVWYILRNVFTCPHMFLTSKHTRKPILNAIHPVYMVRPVLYTLDKLSDNAQGAYNLPRIPPFYTTQLSILQCMLQQCNHTQTSFEGFCSSVRVIGVIRQVFQALHGACCWRILASLAGIVCHSIS